MDGKLEMSKAELLKAMFDVPGHPVTNMELIRFAKIDREGYEKLVTEVSEYTGIAIKQTK